MDRPVAQNSSSDGPSELATHWVLVLTCAIGVGCSAVALPFYTIGVLVAPLSETFSWTRTDIQTAIVFSTGCGALSAPFVGWLIDRYGARVVALPSILALSVAFASAGFISGNIWTLYAAYAAISLLGAGTNPATWTRAIAGAFNRQRGLALGLALTGTGVCAVLAPQYANWLLEGYGWRGVFFGLALVPLLLAFPIAWFGFSMPKASAQDAKNKSQDEWGLTLGEALRSYWFWILLSSIFAIYLAVSGVLPNLIPALTDKGFSAQEATNVFSIIGVSLIVGRLSIGFLIDRFWAPGVASIATGLPVIACLVLITTTDPLVATCAAALIGLAAGAELDLLAFFTARYFGLKHYAKIYAVFYAALAVAGGIAPALFASSYDLAGSYTLSFVVSAALFAFGALVILFLGLRLNQIQ